MTVHDPRITQAAVIRRLIEPLARFFDDRSLFEIIVNRPGEVFIEGPEGWARHEIQDVTFEALMSFAKAVATYSAQKIDATHPVLSATLPGDERIQIVIPPAVPAGTVSVTVRKPSQVTMKLADLGAGGLFDEVVASRDDLSPDEHELMRLYEAQAWMDFLAYAVRSRKNILISGATGSGKTTLSKALIAEIPDGERIVTIEDTPELVIPQPNHVRLFYPKGGQGQAKIRAKDLLESCLRMRPDRILLQELRDGTAFYYIRNVNSGHPGSITTVHADSARLAFEQLTLLVKESEGGQDLDREDIRQLLYLLVDIVVQCKRMDGGFRVTEVYFDPYAKRRSAPVSSVS
jgi:type IV secretion system protein VirB11